MKNERFYVKRPTGKVFGPFDQNAVQMMLKSSKLGADAEISTDKQSWAPILSVPAFSDAMSGAGDEGSQPRRATMMGGWQDLGGESGGLPAVKGKDADLPAAKKADADLPASKKADVDLPAVKGSGGRPELPAAKSSASAPGLPAPKRPGGPPPELPALKSSSTSSSGLPTPKGISDLPTPKGSGDLPAARGAGLPTRKGGDLPVASGGANLPTATGGGLPIPKGGDLPIPAADLPSPKDALPAARDADLPAPASASGALPVPKPFDDADDLFGSGPELDEESDLFGANGIEDDLFGDPLGGKDDDDLFGAPSQGSDDLFGAPSQGADDDLFGDPIQATAHTSDDDLFSSPLEDEDDLFGAPSAGVDESDLFGTPSEAQDDDIFGGPPPGADDDFLGGAAGFSFLDDKPAPADEWGDDLFGDSSASSASEGVHEPSAPAADWGDDLLDLEPRQPRGTTAPAATPADDDAFRPASTGKRAEPEKVSAKVSRESAVDADKKRGRMTMIAVPILAVALLGIGYVAISSFMTEDVKPAPVKKSLVTAGADTSVAKSDNYSDYAPLADAKTKPAADDTGKYLFLQSMMLSRYPSEGLKTAAAENAAKLDNAKEGWDALGRGAFEAQAGNADAARAYLEPLATAGGELGYFANLAMGIGDVKAVEAEAERRASLAPQQQKPAKPLAPAPKVEVIPGTNNAGGTNGAVAGTNGAAAGTNNAVVAVEEPVAPPPAKSDFGGLVERGYAALEAAAKLDPKAPTPRYWSGRLAKTAGDTERARKDLKTAVTLGPKHIASLVEFGDFEYQQGNLNEAIELLEKVSGELSDMAANSEKARALHFGGLVHVARRQTDLAIESFTKALSIDPSRSDTLRSLAEEYERAHRYKEALNFFTTNKNLGKNDPEVMLGIVRSHIGLEQWLQAIATLEEGQRQFPDDAQFPYYLGQLYMKRYAFADAKKPLERAVEIEPSLLTAHATLALLAWRQDKDVQKAEAHISTIVSFPDQIDTAVATQVAEYYHESGNRVVAEQWYREALTRNPNHWPARLALSKLLLEEGKQEQAKELLERARKEGVQDVRLSAYLADAYRQAGDFDRAVDEINKVIEAFPKNEEYVFIRGRIHFDRGNYDTAQDDFQRAYDLNPRFHDAYFYVGRTAYEREDFENALKIFRHVLDYKPDRGNYRFMMARTLQALNRDGQALDEYRKATAVDPAYGVENPMVYVYRGRLLTKLGYSREGKDDIARALELAPRDPLALVAMAESDFRDKIYEDAIKNYKAALELEPADPEGQFRLGMSYLYTDRRQEAAQRLQLAIKYGYDDPEVYKRLGYLYRDLGSRSQAAEAFKKFLERSETKGNVPAATKREVLDQLKMLQ